LVEEQFQNRKDSNIAYSIGFIYFNGFSVDQNDTKALYYFKIAANQGHSDAQNSLGNMYYYGYEAEINITTAIEWFELAVN
jgi:TPR repeat protein